MTSMHRHFQYVDHGDADHNHGACSEHAHWAGGSHVDGTPLEISDAINDSAAHHPSRYVARDEFGNLDTYRGLAGR